MKISILEPGSTGHYTYVESIAQILSAEAENQIDIYTSPSGAENLKHLQNERTHIFSSHQIKNWENYFTEISEINYDLVIPVTFEPVSDESFAMLQGFINTSWKSEIWFILHNLDFWFQQSFFQKLRRIFITPFNVKVLKYRIKQVFLFPRQNNKLLTKVMENNGSFGVLSTTIARTLKNYIPADRIKIIPFSVFVGKTKSDTIQNNSVNSIDHPDVNIRISIPGYVSGVRRDYDSVFDSLLKFPSVKSHCVIELLGGVNSNEGGDEIIKRCKLLKSQGFKILFYDIPKLSLSQFDEQLQVTDFILGNLHIDQQAGSEYGKSKESGIPYSMIKMAKPGFLPVGYPVEPELEPSVLRFSSYDQLMEMIGQLILHPENLAVYRANALRCAAFFSPENVYQRLFKR